MEDAKIEETKILSIEQLKNVQFDEILSLYRQGYRIEQGYKIENLQCNALANVSLTGNNMVCPITVSLGNVTWAVDWAGGQPPFRVILYIDGGTVGFYQTGQVPSIPTNYWVGTVATKFQGIDWTAGSHRIQAQVIDSCTPTAQVTLSNNCYITVTSATPPPPTTPPPATCTSVIGGLILSGGKYYQCYTDIKHGAAPNSSDVSYLCGIGVTNEAQLQQWIIATEGQQGTTYPSCTAAIGGGTPTPPPPPPTTPPPPPPQYYVCTNGVCQPSTTCPIGNCFTTSNCNNACTTVPPPGTTGCSPACNPSTQICFLGLSCIEKKYITYGALGIGAILIISIIK